MKYRANSQRLGGNYTEEQRQEKPVKEFWHDQQNALPELKVQDKKANKKTPESAAQYEKNKRPNPQMGKKT